jgi:hypothetical protein
MISRINRNPSLQPMRLRYPMEAVDLGKDVGMAHLPSRKVAS